MLRNVFSFHILKHKIDLNELFVRVGLTDIDW